MILPRPAHFDPTAYKDAPSWLGHFFAALNRALGDIHDAVSSYHPDQIIDGLAFTTAPNGAAYLDMKNPIAPRKPKDVHVGELRALHGADIANPYACTWQASGSTIRLLFVGLDVSTQYIVTVSVQ